MKRKVLFVVFVSVVAVLGSLLAVSAQGPGPQRPTATLGSGFTYQGQLKKSGAAINATCSMTYTLWTDPSAGAQLGTAQTINPVTVTNGLFTVQVNSGGQFGANAFTGDARWLEIVVQCPGDTSDVTLSRQPLSAAPYALYSIGNWGLLGNANTLPGTNFLGTTDNQALEFKVNDVRALRLEPATGSLPPFAVNSPNLIGGIPANRVAPGIVAATIGGGGLIAISGTQSLTLTQVISGLGGTIGGGYANVVSDTAGTIGGGVDNVAGNQATVGGGIVNHASGPAATVSGGRTNTAGGEEATVAGGTLNSAAGSDAVIGGGYENSIVSTTQRSVISGGAFNMIAGSWAAIPGGTNNVASGNLTFAAGNSAKANQDGAFVWADNNNHAFNSGGANHFDVRATGGISLVTAINAFGSPIAGVYVAAGGSGWNAISDRSAKMNFQPVDGRQVLALLVALPLETWNYKTQDPSIRHLGPMAQDFHAAFNVGDDNVSINSIDEQGVALAAVQGLNQIMQAQQVEIARLKEQVNASGQASQESSQASHPDGMLRALVGLSLLMNLLLGGVLVVHLRHADRA